MNTYTISDKRIIINYNITREIRTIEPKAIENCMVPETFHITPITRMDDDNFITYEVGDNKITVSKEDISKEIVTIKTEAFHPTVVRRTGGCKPCTNCGRCSW